jgi:hypothetical protein
LIRIASFRNAKRLRNEQINKAQAVKITKNKP